MKSIVVAGLAAAVAAAPTASGSQCAASADGKFTITTVQATAMRSKRAVYPRQLDGILTMSLKDGKLTDQAGRTGYIASNYQFQFDGPVQAGALDTDGFGLCSDGSLSLKGSNLWYQCLSGNFYNLYSKSIGDQCIAIHIIAMTDGQGSGVTQIPDGQPQASAPAVSQISDGQPQASAPAPAVTQISDGQPQVTGSPGPGVTQISDGQPQVTGPPAPPVTQISDGQPQVTGPPAPPVTQISDGQPQVTSPPAPPVTQISDGQPQVTAPPAPPAPPVTQISDGQPQVTAPPAPPAPPVSQISDGQPQVTAPPAPPVSQISDGQPQVTAPPAPAPISNNTGNATSPPIPEYTGAAATTVASIGALAAGFFAVFAFL
ncbi:hypothetical protein yc1106_07948 [Curvularia clavata]|uniref:Cell wall mannoprotein PIR1-like C-terminal domain-containing protein n=1 Tax=Curvularia clavata TaxID=95742 RepID=A0A9Q8ZFU3_CURCL|nr:hypothetical protein yc1106_07948 [Curvularia clavata]